jgi:hypothetical protein
MQNPRGTPPATVEPLGSHGRCESATTQAPNDDDVGEFADSERARAMAARAAGHHQCSGAAPHVQWANPHTRMCAGDSSAHSVRRGTRMCALGAPRALHRVVVRRCRRR